MKSANIVIGASIAVLIAAGAYAFGTRSGYLGGTVIAPKSKTPTNTGGKKHSKAYLEEDDPDIHTDDLGPRKWKIIDVHEHAKDEKEAARLLDYMDKFGIQRVCLMGSTEYTLTLNPMYGFEGFKENNENLINIKKKWPDRFCAFITINPEDEGNLALLQDYVKRGADGLKLYIGHGGSTGKGPFHSMRIDDPRMDPVFAWAEQVQLPIVLHVNLDKFWDEMLNVLEKHPYLRVNMPHMGLQKNNEGKLKRIGFLLERYPYAYTDMSWGYYTYQQDGFETFAINKRIMKPFLEQHRDKMMYASDMVLEPSKDGAYIENTLRSYMQILEKPKWRFNIVPKKIMIGMGLDDETLHHIYEVAPSSWLMLDAKGRLPDRTKGWPIEGVPVPPRPPIPPLTAEMIPPVNGHAASLPPPAPSAPSPGSAAAASPSKAPGEEPEKDGAPVEKQGGGELEIGGDDEGEEGDVVVGP